MLTPEDKLHDLARRLERLGAPYGVLIEAATLGDFNELLPEEWALTVGWAESRRTEFRMGRACARRALQRLGLDVVAVPIGRGGAPAWPSEAVGSVSHKEWACMVAVGRRFQVGSLGVDLELLQPANDFSGEVCTPSEIRRLPALAASTKSPLDLVVVAKEAFYKCQYPLTGRELSWHDVEIEIDSRAPVFKVFATEPYPVNPVGFFAELDPWIGAVCVASPTPR